MSGGAAAAAVIIARQNRRRALIHHFMIREAVTARKAIGVKEIPHADEFLTELQADGVVVSTGAGKFYLSLPAYVEKERQDDENIWPRVLLVLLILGAFMLAVIYG